MKRSAGIGSFRQKRLGFTSYGRRTLQFSRVHWHGSMAKEYIRVSSLGVDKKTHALIISGNRARPARLRVQDSTTSQKKTRWSFIAGRFGHSIKVYVRGTNPNQLWFFRSSPADVAEDIGLSEGLCNHYYFTRTIRGTRRGY